MSTGSTVHDDEKPASAKATGLVALAVMSSRVLGLVREMMFASYFNGGLRDTFIAAFRLPNLLRDLFAEGALSTAFITVFSQKMKTEGDASAWSLAHRMLTMAAVVMSIISLIGIASAKPLVGMLLYKWNMDKQGFTVLLTQIMFPFIMLVSLAALIMGMLNAKKVFGIPAMASSCFNILSIVGGFGLAWILDDRSVKGLDANGMIGFSIGTLLGGLGQLLVQIPALRKVGYRFRPDFTWNDSSVQRVLRLMVPSIIAGSAVQVNVFVNTGFAAALPLQNGPTSWLNVAFRLMQLPLGVFGVTVATLTIPVISRVATDGISSRFREVIGSGLRLVTFLTLPCAAGLYFLAHPVISVLYERGQFLAWETVETAAILKWYAIGLVFYSCIKIIQPAFTAIDRNRIPMYVAFLSIAVNAVMNYVFVHVLRKDHVFLAFTTTTVAALNFVLLYFFLAKFTGGLETRRLIASTGRLLLPLAALSAVAWATWNFTLAPHWSTLGQTGRAVGLGLAITASVTAFGMLAELTGLEEVRQFSDMVSRKLERFRRR
jgi:putative peptidoglycan lipid II flippase